MLVIKINADNDPALKRSILRMLADSGLDLDVASFAWEEDHKPTGPAARSGKTGQDLASSLSSSVDKLTHG